ncbi:MULTISPECIES: ABC transporter permease [Microbispora]|uniref:ABC transporter permease n=2 Tax=Microbispora TaxID=2005 RepID=A0A5N6BVG3_9ACTN|nr:MULTISPECIES: ABC transporter permease [Microbispora]KAB8184484.1 ABC transporter permease [Microbispora catharanthi]TQS25493.1 ABC transporter permease [Microbispora sp. KK1-11]GIH62935.1 sugar ABC transporter permease [Microbispora siamensis]GLX09204.1 sugar ABC transporter permease [Microbispora sp. NBRC 16548]
MAEAVAPPGRRVLAWAQEYGVYAAVGVLLLFNVLFTPHFLDVANFRTQLVQVAPIVIVSLGMALVIGTQGIDLSVGSVMSLAAALVALYLGYGAWPALLVALVGGAVAGTAGGALVAYVGVQPIVATLALLVGVRGLANVLVPQLVEFRNPDLIALGSSSLSGVPVIVVIAAVLTLLMAFLVRRTTFGRQVVAIGGNRAASELSGLPVRRVLLLVYVISGVLAALAGVLATARLQASDPTSLGLFIELSAITAVVVGGTPLSGGRIRVLSTVMGALLMQLLSATLIKHNLPQSWTQIVQAVIILAAVYATRERGTR